MRKTSIINNLSDKQVVVGVLAGDYAVFTGLYSCYFHNLSLVALKYVKDIFVAEGIVQEVFIKLWEKTVDINEINSIKAYLYRSVINLSINHLNREKNIEKHHLKIAEKIEEDEVNQLHEEQELKQLIYREIERLPSQCKRVFKMSRFEHKKYREIALELNITEKTVENHIVNALKTLRGRLLVQGSSKGGPYQLKMLSFLLFA